MHLHFHKVKQTFTKEFCTTFCFVFTLGFLGLSLYLYERWTCNPRNGGKKKSHWAKVKKNIAGSKKIFSLHPIVRSIAVNAKTF